MGNNFHTAYSNTVPKTAFTVAAMGAPLSSLDCAITYLKNVMVGGGGTITWAAGTLTWSGTINIYFNASADGKACHNTIAASNIALSDDEFAYVTLSETNDAVITVSKASIGDGSASGFLAYNVLVLGYRNAADDVFYPVSLSGIFAKPSTATYVAAGEQSITCGDTVTVDWSLGATAEMTFDRGAVALTFTNPAAGGVYRLILTQGDGSDLATWTTPIKWSGGAAPVLSTAAGAIDIITFVYTNSTWYGSATLNFASV
jgi:hypothetical protein